LRTISNHTFSRDNRRHEEGKASKRRTLKSSQAKQLVEDFKRFFPQSALDLERGQIIEEVVVDKGKLYFADDKPLVISVGGKLLPSLANEELLKTLPSLVVDMGAIPHICNGADIMRPGIKQIQGDFEKGTIVLVKDQKFSKPIAIGVAEAGSASIRAMSKGMAAKNVHYVGDSFWEAVKVSR